MQNLKTGSATYLPLLVAKGTTTLVATQYVERKPAIQKIWSSTNDDARQSRRTSMRVWIPSSGDSSTSRQGGAKQFHEMLGSPRNLTACQDHQRKTARGIRHTFLAHR